MRMLLVASLVALAGLSLAFGEDSVSSGEREEHSVPNVIDASGKVVGPLVYFDGPAEGGVILSINGVLVYAGIGRVGDADAQSATEFEWFGEPGYYTTADCSGNAFIISPSGPFRPNAIFRSGSSVAIYVASGAPPQILTFRSAATVDPRGCFPLENSQQDTAWAIESTFDLTQHYPEPLRIGY